MQNQGWTSQSGAIFFGPRNNWKEEFLEEAFLLQYHLNMSYTVVRSLPVTYRRWFLSRLAKEFQQQAERTKKASERSDGMREIPIDDIMDKVHEKAFEKSFKK